MSRIAAIAAEVAPHVKTGGLGDVVGALPDALAAHGAQVVVFAPYYRLVAELDLPVIETGITVSATVGGHERRGRLLRLGAVCFVDCPELFDREGVYGPAVRRGYDAAGYRDNPARFAFLCLSALQAAPALLGGPVDIFHLHDWQASLTAALMAGAPWRDRHPQAHTVLTIHNLAYQGVFPPERLAEVQLGGAGDWLNLLAAAIRDADAVTTVSPTYAREITSPRLGCGLDAALRARGVTGILNGIDTTTWNPALDPLIAANYTADDRAGKAACRSDLCAEMGLPDDPETPLLGMVARFTSQKGLDLIAALVPELESLGARLVMLGTGDPDLEDEFRMLAAEHPDRLSARIGFDDALAHRGGAGSDLYLMPSRFEPCGLNQLYAQAYGTVPVVHGVGGLADTVEDGRTGFVFDAPTAASLREAIVRGVACYGEPARWTALQDAGMARDSSWRASAQAYLELFRSLGES